MITEEEQRQLIAIIRGQFVDIVKVISFVDPVRANEFKKRNGAAMRD